MIILRKKAFLISTFFCLVFVLVSCATSQHSDDQVADENTEQEEVSNKVSNNMTDSLTPGIHYQPEAGDVVTYTLSQKAFQEFLLQPSMDILSEKCDNLSVYKKDAIIDGYVQLEMFKSDGYYTDGELSGYFRIGNWPVYLEFIDFMNNKDNFKQILLEYDINDELLSCVIIAHRNYNVKNGEPIPPGTAPIMCIWLHTNSGDYFLENNPYLYSDPRDTHFLYDFYNLKDYSQKYGDN